MRASLPVAVVLALLGLPASPCEAAAQELGAVAPLFADTEPLRLRIEADFDQLKDDRDEENEERTGLLVILGADDSELHYPLEVRTRGRFRLQSRTCRFPPLRLDVRTSAMDGTPFEGQDKLKLVTHCRDSDRYEQNTVKEYLVYRIYNLMTDRSFGARLARITYTDTSGEDDPVERWGFVIEAEEALAERLGGVVNEDGPTFIPPAMVSTADAIRLTLFQYMVGNTDFSIYQQHNVVPVDHPDGSVTPVPYDFDWTGLVDAPYARPDPSLNTRNVRQRVFRGLCRVGIDYAAAYADLLAKRGAITALVESEQALSDDEREDVLDYLEDFWEVLEDEGDVQREIERSCRSV
ncbi:MAG: hypothetical protein KJP18_12550 [Gemmatimonadetes bacterium]|nr:hypothetical protein [Gemmatimonadota bacterium]